jgi:hypothetical protein
MLHRQERILAAAGFDMDDGAKEHVDAEISSVAALRGSDLG